MLASCYGGLACERPGREALRADFDALDLACRLLSVHVHLLSNVSNVVDPHGIQGAGYV